MADDNNEELKKILKDVLSKKQEDLEDEMTNIASHLDDTTFIMLMETIAKIEPGPARILLKEAAERLRSKVAN